MASIQRFSTVVAGLAAENMVRGGSWLFLDMGRRVERAALTVDHLAVVLDQPETRWELGLQARPRDLRLGDHLSQPLFHDAAGRTGARPRHCR